MDASSLDRDAAPLIITGMHRSGTSLLAGFFHRSGFHLGERLLGAKPSNPLGHFEDVEILEFHRAILQREFGHTMWAPGPPALTAADRAKAEALIAARGGKARLWGWKEPRTCLFLDLWYELLPGARFLFVVRKPRLVLDSLGRRTNTRWYHFWVHDQFLRAWLVYNRQCLHFLQGHPGQCVLILLEDVLRSPRFVVAHLSQWLGISLDTQVFREFFDPEVLTDRPVRRRVASPILYGTCLAVYRHMQRLGLHPDAQAAPHASVGKSPRTEAGQVPCGEPEGSGRSGALGPGGAENL